MMQLIKMQKKVKVNLLTFVYFFVVIIMYGVLQCLKSWKKHYLMEVMTLIITK